MMCTCTRLSSRKSQTLMTTGHAPGPMARRDGALTARPRAQAEAAVCDLGLQSSEVDRIVSGASGVQDDGSMRQDRPAAVMAALASGRRLFGTRTRHVLLVTAPYYLLLALPMQLGLLLRLGDRAVTKLMLLHVLRVAMLLRCFRRVCPPALVLRRYCHSVRLPVNL